MPFTISAGTGIRVSGETLITWKGMEIGMSIEGINVSLNSKEEEVTIDPYGKVPGEIVRNITEAEIEAEVIIFNAANLGTMLTQHLGMNATGYIGGLVLGSGLAGQLRLLSKLAGGTLGNNLVFGATYLTDSYEVAFGTKRSTWKLKWRALPGYNDPLGHVFGNPLPPLFSFSTT